MQVVSGHSVAVRVWQPLWRAVIHLRLHFQAILAPIFLWGVLLSNSPPDLRTWLVFLAYHVGLYGGATAFNSVYDRDTGPVGGLRTPPPVDPFLLPWSLAFLFLGLPLCLVRPATALPYAIVLALALAYSHPAIRLKARPWASLVTIAVGQGVLPCLAGIFATPAPVVDAVIWPLGAASAAFVAIAFYPLTQLYQVEEDRARGDRTIAVALGVSGSFALSTLLLVVAAAFTSAAVTLRFGPLEAALVLGFYSALIGATRWWRRRFQRWDTLRNFRAAMAFTSIGSGGFAVYLIAHLLAAYA